MVQRYEWPQVGGLLHVDLKRLGRVSCIGHRIHGDRRRRARHVGGEYLHVAIDDATRLTYAEVLAADDAPTCAAFLQRTLTWFRRRGIRIHRLLTDNAMAYRAHALAAVCRRWAVRHRFTKPYRPQTNGKARALRSNAAARVGLPRPLSELGAAHRRARPLSPLL